MNKEYLLPIILTLLPAFCCLAVSETPSASQSGLEGVISISPARGGPERLDGPNSKPLPNIDFVVKKGDVTVTSFKTDDEGRFRISLPAGHYVISKKDGKGRFGNYGPFEVDVAAGEIKKVQWTCDSGIR